MDGLFSSEDRLNAFLLFKQTKSIIERRSPIPGSASLSLVVSAGADGSCSSVAAPPRVSQLVPHYNSHQVRGLGGTCGRDPLAELRC